MAKRRNRPEHRDPTPVATTPVVAVRSSSYYVDLARSIEDRRLHHPEQVMPARVVSGPRARITVAPPAAHIVRAGVRARNAQKLKQGLIKHMRREQHVFVSPQSVMICLRRKIRAQVLHALKKTKSGRGAKKRRNYHSDVRC